MDQKEQITQLLASVANILETGMEELGKDIHFTIITGYPESDVPLCSFISNIEGQDLEDLLIGAIIASREKKLSYINKDEYLQ